MFKSHLTSAHYLLIQRVELQLHLVSWVLLQEFHLVHCIFKVLLTGSHLRSAQVHLSHWESKDLWETTNSGFYLFLGLPFCSRITDWSEALLIRMACLSTIFSRSKQLPTDWYKLFQMTCRFCLLRKSLRPPPLYCNLQALLLGRNFFGLFHLGRSNQPLLWTGFENHASDNGLCLCSAQKTGNLGHSAALEP